MGDLEKLEFQSEIRASAERVYDIFKRKMYLMPTICPQVVKDVKLVRGDWETPGSVRAWKYVAGNSESGRETIEAVDDQNMTITFDALDGDFTKYYKTIKAKIRVIAKGKKSVAKWSLIYEKVNSSIPDPDRYLDVVSMFNEAVDAYLHN
ncbi:hypothetical protein COLO4_13147 [Corchorus olitorius]|uniref:Bet v I/Major latex protein domain-containing protein n=1 Tax=Corchorus olitorius TaxID=93759 RepID=A0A1R3JY01_9ROSI|nr:hypothetical protein COLO4_13147 [Corchorus olitorius]